MEVRSHGLLFKSGVQKAAIDHCHEDALGFSISREKDWYRSCGLSGVGSASSIGYAVGRWLAESKLWGTSYAG